MGRARRAPERHRPGIIVTSLALDEFNGPRSGFYKNMFAKCPAGRPGTADEVANVAELLMSDKGAFITGSTFLIRRRDRELLLRPAAPRKSMIFPPLSLKKAAESPEHSGGSAAFFTQICFSHSVLIVFTPKRK